MPANSTPHVPATPALSPIAILNDAFRRSCRGGTFVATSGVTALGRSVVAQIIAQVRSFDSFTPDNDPYGEHDSGAFAWHGICLFWKIDCSDADLRYASPDPADPTVTARMLTVMLAEEY